MLLSMDCKPHEADAFELDHVITYKQSLKFNLRSALIEVNLENFLPRKLPIIRYNLLSTSSQAHSLFVPQSLEATQQYHPSSITCVFTISSSYTVVKQLESAGNDLSWKNTLLFDGRVKLSFLSHLYTNPP